MKRTFGDVKVETNFRDGKPCGSRVHVEGHTFEVPHWPSRVTAVEKQGDTYVLKSKTGNTRVLDPNFDAITEGGSEPTWVEGLHPYLDKQARDLYARGRKGPTAIIEAIRTAVGRCRRIATDQQAKTETRRLARDAVAWWDKGELPQGTIREAAEAIAETHEGLCEAVRHGERDDACELLEAWLSDRGDRRALADDPSTIFDAAERIVRGGPPRARSATDERVMEAMFVEVPVPERTSEDEVRAMLDSHRPPSAQVLLGESSAAGPNSLPAAESSSSRALRDRAIALKVEEGMHQSDARHLVEAMSPNDVAEMLELQARPRKKAKMELNHDVPPNLQRAFPGAIEKCGTCSQYLDGTCVLHHNFPVSEGEVCDDFRASGDVGTAPDDTDAADVETNEADVLPDEEPLEEWIAGAIKRPGQLHRDLGVKQGEKIPLSKVKAAAKKKGKVGARARLALVLRRRHMKEAIDHGVTHVPWEASHTHVKPGTNVRHASWRASQWDGELTGKKRTAVDQHREYEVNWTGRYDKEKKANGWHRREDLLVPAPEESAGFTEADLLIEDGIVDEAPLLTAFEAAPEETDAQEAGGASEAEYRAKAARYAGPGGGIGSRKREDIGRGKGRKYPPGFQHLRNELINKGHTVADASRIAYGALRRWARGGGNVKASTRAKAQKVLAQLHASPVSAHREGYDPQALAGDVIEALKHVCANCAQGMKPDAKYCSRCGTAAPHGGVRMRSDAPKPKRYTVHNESDTPELMETLRDAIDAG